MLIPSLNLNTVPVTSLKKWALSGVAQWMGIILQTKRLLVPRQGTCLGCRPGPWLGPVRGHQEATN